MLDETLFPLIKTKIHPTHSRAFCWRLFSNVPVEKIKADLRLIPARSCDRRDIYESGEKRDPSRIQIFLCCSLFVNDGDHGLCIRERTGMYVARDE